MRRQDISKVIDRALAEAGLDVHSSSLKDVMNILRHALAADEAQAPTHECGRSLEASVIRANGDAKTRDIED